MILSFTPLAQPTVVAPFRSPAHPILSVRFPKCPTAFSFPASAICSFSALAKYKVARASNQPSPSKSCYPAAPRSTRPQSRLRSLRSSQSHNTNSRRSFLRQRLMAARWPTQLFPTSISFYLPPTRSAHKTAFHLKIFQS